MRYCIFDHVTGEFFCKKGEWDGCCHDGLESIKWGDDLKQLRNFRTKADVKKCIKRLTKEFLETDPSCEINFKAIPIINEFRAIELDLSEITI